MKCLIIKQKTHHLRCEKNSNGSIKLKKIDIEKEETFLEVLNVLRGKSDPNLVDLLLRLLQTWLSRLHCRVRHCFQGGGFLL